MGTGRESGERKHGMAGEHEADVRRACTEEGHTLFWASNFSLGVAIFSAVNKYLARIMNRYPDYDVSEVETHHIHKLDAPSGTAITLAEQICAEIDRKTDWVKGEVKNADGTVSGSKCHPDNLLRIDAVREGEVPGIHTITYNSEADLIEIKHSAHNRSGFALGAVLLCGIHGYARRIAHDRRSVQLLNPPKTSLYIADIEFGKSRKRRFSPRIF